MGAGSGAGSEVSDDVARVARRAVGSGRRGALCVVRGAETVTSGSVSDTWAEAGSGEVSPPASGNAPKATAPKSRRFQPDSDLRRTQNAPNTTPPDAIQSPLQAHLVDGFLSCDLLANWTGTLGNVASQETEVCRLGRS